MTPLTDSSAHGAAARVSSAAGSSLAVIDVGRRFVLAGRVQGLGVRPAIFHLATKLGVRGCVRNSERGVEIEVEGRAADLATFEQKLPRSLPDGTELAHLAIEQFVPLGRRDFTIAKEPADGPLATRVPEDRSVCANCLGEIHDLNDRRAGYAFTSCTQCGPRYSVIRQMPFDREATTMERFKFCATCQSEYERPGDRRFHAQTTACPDCGPQVWCSIPGSQNQPTRENALCAVVTHLRNGKIVALRGIGGYQLLVDATNEAAVERLRERKGRRAKPLAVMVESLEAAERLGYLNTTERDAFSDWTAPIVLVRARDSTDLAVSIHPDFYTVGLMRPTTPLHDLVVRGFGRPIVCTSGNRDGEPLEYEIDDAERKLGGIADLWLHHDREIIRPIDDSVVRVIAGRRVTIRLARGLAPLALDLHLMEPTIAVGGFLKAAVAWSNGTQAVLGPHIGDQQDLPSRERYAAHMVDLQQLYRFRSEKFVHDMHPDYYSTQWAQSHKLPMVAVQHHHAHIVAGMLEHGWLDRPVIGVAWDGTGYGPDGTIWGGELLISTAQAFRRVARLRPFRLPGGEAAIHEPWRTAVSVCHQVDWPIDAKCYTRWGVDSDRVATVQLLVNRPQLSPLTSSAGRLFDAAAALVLGMGHSSFDGQAAMQLEAIADHSAEGYYGFPWHEGEVAELDWRLLFAGLLVDLRREVSPATMAMRFHRSLARGIVRACRRWPDMPIVFSGGVFQNRLLTELIVEMLEDSPQQIGLPGIIPPNDGGLAAGQLAVAAAQGGFLPCA